MQFFIQEWTLYNGTEGQSAVTDEFIPRLLKTLRQILTYFGPFPKLKNKLKLGVAMQTATLCNFVWIHHLGTLIFCPNYCKDFSVLPNSYNTFYHWQTR